MARATLTPVKIAGVNEIKPGITFTTLSDAANGGAYAAGGKDFKTVILVKGGAAAGKLTVKAGNGIQGVNDIVLDVPATNYAAFTLDSGAFKNVSGADKGKVIMIPSAADLSVAVIELP